MMTTLIADATTEIGFTPEVARAGGEGKVFLKVSSEVGVLLHVRSFGKAVKARVISARNTANFPLEWVELDADITHWCDPDLFGAIKAWRDGKPANG